MKKLLVVLAILLTSCDSNAEDIDKLDGEISNIMVTIFWFNTLNELQSFVDKHLDDGFDESLQGYSLMERYKDRDFCHLDMFVVRPTKVDDDHTLTIGHEMVHCVYGEHYHMEVE